MENTRADRVGKETLAKCDLTDRRMRAFNVFNAQGRFVDAFDDVVSAKRCMSRCSFGAIVVRYDGALLAVRVEQLMVYPDKSAGRVVGADLGEGQ